jgi:uncharacterized protein
LNAMTLPKPHAAPAKPWYREPWPWLLMAGPGTVIVAGIATAWIAFSGADGLVADDYYKQGLSINRTLARDAQAKAMGLEGEMVVREGVVRVTLRSTKPLPDRLSLRFAHPARASDDRVVFLARRSDSSWEAPVPVLAPIPWRAIVETADWRIAASYDPRAATPARLEPGVR